MRFRNGTRQREPVHKPLEATTTTMGTPRMLKMTRNEKAEDEDEDDAIDDDGAPLEDEALMEKASMAYK